MGSFESYFILFKSLTNSVIVQESDVMENIVHKLLCCIVTIMCTELDQAVPQWILSGYFDGFNPKVRGYNNHDWVNHLACSMSHNIYLIYKLLRAHNAKTMSIQRLFNVLTLTLR